MSEGFIIVNVEETKNVENATKTCLVHPQQRLFYVYARMAGRHSV